MKKALAVVGDFYHNGDLIRQSLNEILDPLITEEVVQLKYCETRMISQHLKENPDIVILFAEDRVDPENDPELRWMTPEISKQIAEYVDQGGAWIAWHAGMASYDADSEYITMLRGFFIHHPQENTEVTYQSMADASSLGMNSVQFSCLDEHYFVECDEASTHVFLRSSSDNGEAPAGWVHTFGQGRVGCITPAHRSEGLLHPAFIACMRDLFGWAIQLPDSGQ